MFERPWLLFGLALLLPVLIAFLFKQRERLATVPSTLLFQRVALARIKNRRIRSLFRRLAMLACIAAVGICAIAAAEPRPGGATSSTAIVVDVSSSMRGAPIDDARSAVARMLRERHGNEHVAVILAGAAPRHLVGPTREGSLLDGAVDAIAIEEEGEADLVAAVELADRLMRSRRRARIVVISDGGAASVEDDVFTDAELSVLRVGGPRENVGVTVFAARPPADARTDADREVLVTVAASAGADRRVAVILEADGEELERREIDVPAKGEAEVSLRLRAPARSLSARVAPIDGRGDDLSSDDVATIAIGAMQAPRVHLIARQDAVARFFVERALRAAGVREIERHDPEDAPAIGPGALAVVLDEAPERAIEGPALYLATSEGAVPYRVHGRLEGEDETALRSIDARHPLTRGVVLDESTIDRALAIDVPPEASSVVELVGGATVATGGAGRARWVAIGIDPSGSDLVLRVAFPVLVANALAQLVGASDVRVAETVPRGEVELRPTALLADRPRAARPWPLPASPAFLILPFAALLLLGEGLAYAKGWAR